MTAPRKRALEKIPAWTWYHSSQHQHKMDNLRRRHQQQQQQDDGMGKGTGGETRDDGHPYHTSFDPTHVEQIAHVRHHRQQQVAKSIDPSTFVFHAEDMTQKRYQQWMDRFKVVYQYVRANNGVLPKVTYRNIEKDGFDVGMLRFFFSLSLWLRAYVFCVLIRHRLRLSFLTLTLLLYPRSFVLVLVVFPVILFIGTWIRNQRKFVFFSSSSATFLILGLFVCLLVVVLFF